jgi:hypothetical protein
MPPGTHPSGRKATTGVGSYVLCLPLRRPLPPRRDSEFLCDAARPNGWRHAACGPLPSFFQAAGCLWRSHIKWKRLEPIRIGPAVRAPLLTSNSQALPPPPPAPRCANESGKQSRTIFLVLLFTWCHSQRFFNFFSPPIFFGGWGFHLIYLCYTEPCHGARGHIGSLIVSIRVAMGTRQRLTKC